MPYGDMEMSPQWSNQDYMVGGNQEGWIGVESLKL